MKHLQQICSSMHYSQEQLIELKATYRRKLRELKEKS